MILAPRRLSLVAVAFSLAFPLEGGAAASLPDPTAPPDFARPPTQEGTRTDVNPAPRPTHRLAGIRIGPRGRMAILDGRPVRPGDPIDGGRVEEITLEGVLLQLGTDRLLLRFPAAAGMKWASSPTRARPTAP
jgi:hypothetical protein